MILIPHNQPTEVVKPSEQPFDLPPSSIPSQWATILAGRFASATSMRSDQLHVSFFGQSRIQRVAVIGLVSHHPLGQFVQNTRIQRRLDPRYFMRARAADVHGERKTMSVCKAHDFGAFAPLGLAHTIAPFFAGAKVPSMKPSLRSMPPRSRRSSASAVRILANTPEWLHAWKHRWHVLLGGYRSGRSAHGAPVRRIQRIPLSTSRRSCGGRPDLPGPALAFGMNGSIRSHCSLVRSMSLISAMTLHYLEVLGWVLVFRFFRRVVHDFEYRILDSPRSPYLSRPMSTAAAECVIAPMAIRSTPQWAISETLLRLMLPEASSRGPFPLPHI